MSQCWATWVPAHGDAFLLLWADRPPVPVSSPAGESPDVKPGLGPGYIALIAVAVLAVVAGVAALLTVRYQRTTRKYDFKTQPDSFGYRAFRG